MPREDHASTHLVHPLTDNAQQRRTGPFVVVRGEGCELIGEDGQRLIDGFSGLWTVNLGYGRGDLVEAALRQLELLP